MSTYVVLVNERPESHAALDWALQTQSRRFRVQLHRAARHPRSLDRHSGRPSLRVTVAKRRRREATRRTAA